MLSHCKEGNSSITVEKPSLFSLLPVLSLQVGRAVISALVPAGESKQLLIVSVAVVTELLLLEKHTWVLSRGTDTGVLSVGQDQRQPEFSTFTSSPRLHILPAHSNHLPLIVTSFLWKAQKGLRSFPRLSIWLEDEAFCLL